MYDLFKDVSVYKETHKLARIHSARIHGKDVVINAERDKDRLVSTIKLLTYYTEYLESLGYTLPLILAYFEFHRPKLKGFDLYYNAIIGMFYKLENKKPAINIF